MGVKCVKVNGVYDEKGSLPKFDAQCVRTAILDILTASALEGI